MKKLLFLSTIFLIHCSGDEVSGVKQDFIRESFKLSKTRDIAIIDVATGTDCPQVEFDSNNNSTFQIRRSEGNPSVKQTTFTYDNDAYSVDGDKRILKGDNKTNTTYEISFDIVTEIYSIQIDYACADANEPGCANTSFSCSGPLQP